jgi:pimeloyl-ACP methyl ester carboxylesterase
MATRLNPARRIAALVAVAALVGVGFAGCSAPTGVTPIKLGLCGGAEGPNHPERCGTLEVPLVWGDPHGEQLTLEVLVVPAQGTHRAADPLFYLAGYGGSAPWNAQWPYDHLKTVLDTHDLVFVEQRGTGSTAEQCDLPLPQTTDAKVIRDAVDACLASLHRDPRHDTTPNAVRDLDRARQALGYGRINLYGASYGVSMGLAYLQAHPERVRTAVFESGSLLDTRLWERVPTSAQRSFDELVRRCEADPVCGPAFDPAGDLAALVAQLTAQPVPVDVGGRTVTVGPVAFLDAVIDNYLSQPQTAVRLPADLAAMRRGEWAQVLSRWGVTPADLPDERTGLSPEQAQQVTLRCSDEWAQVDPAAVAAQSGSLFSAAASVKAAWQHALCAAWPHDPGAHGVVKTDVPVLFLNGTADPADPPENVAAAAGLMPHATLITVPGGGHGVLSDWCLLRLMQLFVDDAAAAPAAEWQTCTAQFAAGYPAFARG